MVYAAVVVEVGRCRFLRAVARCSFSRAVRAPRGPSMSGTWKQVAIAKQWAVEGGYLNKAVTLETREVDGIEGPMSFVKIEKNAEWLLKAAIGKNNNKGGLRRTRLFDTIKTKLKAPTSDAGATDAAVAASTSEDPMQMLDEVESNEARAPKRSKHAYISKRAKDSISHFDMPEFEPTSHPEKTATRKVAVLALSTNSTWLCVDDVPWLVKWLADEARSGGVPVATDDPLDALACNCEAEHVHIRWDFAGAWEAIVLAGEKKGTKVKSSVAKFTAEKWLAVGAPTQYGLSFENATHEQLKTATFKFVEQHMQGVRK